MVTHQLQVERRTAKGHRPKTDALPLDYTTNVKYGRRGQSTDAGGGSADRVRSQHGLTLSAASAAYVKHEITFKIGLRIAAEIHRHSTHTVCIQYGSFADRGGQSIRRDPQHPCVGVKGVLHSVQQ